MINFLLKRFLITPLFLLLIFFSSAQEKTRNESIYFESAKKELTTASKKILDNLADSIKKLLVTKIVVRGNTDNIGDSSFNKKLSGQRVLAAETYLIEKGISASVFQTASLGEEKPLADNSTEDGKQKNRRVDITVFYTPAIDSSQFLPSIFTLYRQTERKPQEFSIDPKRDTNLRCEYGTIVHIKANSFKISAGCKSKTITLKIKEALLKSDMILDNLSTTSSGKIIETQGMIYSEARDCKGNKLNLVIGKEPVIMIPADTMIEAAKIFQGNRTPHDSIMNWTVNNNSVLSNFSLVELNICHDFICGGVKRCPFFFCKIRNFFRKMLGRKDGVRNPPSKETISKCEILQQLYDKYGVNNPQALAIAVNKPLLDSFRVKTIEELQDTLRKVNLANIETSYLNKTLNYGDYKFYVYNVSRLGWSNVDVFTDVKPEQMANLKINLKVAQNIDCKLVFKNRRFVIPATKEEIKYEFEGIPKGEEVWLIALKYEDGKPFLSMQEITTETKTVDVSFKSLTLEELKAQLQVLN